MSMMTMGTEHTGLETLILSCGYLQGRMPHRIEVFSANCPLCNEIVDEIEAGKCAGCQLTIYDVSKNSSLARQFGVRVVPTVIIDREVKIEGRPDIPFVCSDETYAHFKEKYPVLHELGSSEDRDS